MHGSHDLRAGYVCPPRPAAELGRIFFLESDGEADQCACFSIACWASSGYNVEGCAALEQQLRVCMDAPVSGIMSSCAGEGVGV